MRDYAKVSPKMWHGKTTKELRKRGYEALLVGLYLMTSPSSNMLGLFSQPVLYMAHETGLGIEGATKGLRACIDAGFCSYDEESEFVFVFEMARYQIDSELSAKDLRCKGIQKEYDSLPENPFLGAFFDRYASAFHMTKRRDLEGDQEAPYQAPTKPLRSQEQEQEQEQENICTDLLPESEQPLSEFSIPLNDSTEYRIPLAHINEWRAAYQAVDVAQELRQMRVWIMANPTKRKTRRGVSAFIVRWLGKAQDTPTRRTGGNGASDWTGSAL
jgi:hypothetical protein